MEKLYENQKLNTNEEIKIQSDLFNEEDMRDKNILLLTDHTNLTPKNIKNVLGEKGFLYIADSRKCNDAYLDCEGENCQLRTSNDFNVPKFGYGFIDTTTKDTIDVIMFDIKGYGEKQKLIDLVKVNISTFLGLEKKYFVKIYLTDIEEIKEYCKLMEINGINIENIKKSEENKILQVEGTYYNGLNKEYKDIKDQSEGVNYDGYFTLKRETLVEKIKTLLITNRTNVSIKCSPASGKTSVLFLLEKKLQKHTNIEIISLNVGLKDFLEHFNNFNEKSKKETNGKMYVALFDEAHIGYSNNDFIILLKEYSKRKNNAYILASARGCTSYELEENSKLNNEFNKSTPTPKSTPFNTTEELLLHDILMNDEEFEDYFSRMEKFYEKIEFSKEIKELFKYYSGLNLGTITFLRNSLTKHFKLKFYKGEKIKWLEVYQYFISEDFCYYFIKRTDTYRQFVDPYSILSQNVEFSKILKFLFLIVNSYYLYDNVPFIKENRSLIDLLRKYFMVNEAETGAICLSCPLLYIVYSYFLSNNKFEILKEITDLEDLILFTLISFGSDFLLNTNIYNKNDFSERVWTSEFFRQITSLINLEKGGVKLELEGTEQIKNNSRIDFCISFLDKENDKQRRFWGIELLTSLDKTKIYEHLNRFLEGGQYNELFNSKENDYCVLLFRDINCKTLVENEKLWEVSVDFDNLVMYLSTKKYKNFKIDFDVLRKNINLISQTLSEKIVPPKEIILLNTYNSEECTKVKDEYKDLDSLIKEDITENLDLNEEKSGFSSMRIAKAITGLITFCKNPNLEKDVIKNRKEIALCKFVEALNQNPELYTKLKDIVFKEFKLHEKNNNNIITYKSTLGGGNPRVSNKGHVKDCGPFVAQILFYLFNFQSEKCDIKDELINIIIQNIQKLKEEKLSELLRELANKNK